MRDGFENLIPKTSLTPKYQMRKFLVYRLKRRLYKCESDIHYVWIHKEFPFVRVVAQHSKQKGFDDWEVVEFLKWQNEREKRKDHGFF